MTAYAPDPPDLSVALPIQEASRLLGVPEPTLRSWERRYGLPTTPRSRGGHRRYSADAMRQLRLMCDEIARGRRAADAARSVRLLLEQGGQAVDWVAEVLAASQRLDPVAVRAALDGCHDEMGIAATLDEVLLPSMRRIGTWWETGRCDVAQEHLTTEAARGWLIRMTAAAPAAAPAVVLACGPRDLHTLGLEALAVLLSRDGHDCRILGAQTPPRALVTAAVATAAAGVVVVSHLPTQRRPAVEAIRAVASTDCAVFYAGNAFHLARARNGVPGTYLGENLSAAAARIGASLRR